MACVACRHRRLPTTQCHTLLTAACRLDGTPPNNGYIDGKAIYSAENSGNLSHVTAPYT